MGYSGTNMGSVLQWRYPSHNGKVIKTGAKVTVVEEIESFRPGVKDNELAIFPGSIPATINGTVVTVLNGGNVPTAGTAMINFEFPDYATITGGAGGSTGPAMVLKEEFHKLKVLM